MRHRIINSPTCQHYTHLSSVKYTAYQRNWLGWDSPLGLSRGDGAHGVGINRRWVDGLVLNGVGFGMYFEVRMNREKYSRSFLLFRPECGLATNFAAFFVKFADGTTLCCIDGIAPGCLRPADKAIFCWWGGKEQ